MKARLLLACLGTLVGVATVTSAAPVYAPTDTQGGPPGADLSPATLWQLMTNAGADDGAWDDALRAAVGGSTVTTYSDLGTYNAAVGAHDVITFTEDVVTAGDFLYTQYLGQGVMFADDDEQVLDNAQFVNDQSGAYQLGGGTMTLDFGTAQSHLGIAFPGNLRIELYSGAVNPGNLVWSSDVVGDFGSVGSLGNFTGLESDTAFDHVVLSDPVDDWAFIDDIHYLVPEPTTALLLGAGVVGMLGRRRFNGGSR